ncbi:MAG: 16S rRNA (guanine(527)-N(7))-methyltransferase RsmG [Chloroflexi bacterium]|nr:16S rRNA (guanine(527)-N(7))-methyltransferase RsmG [Chloroflexota bacterium]
MQTLADYARAFEIALSDSQLAAFETYSRELVAWNARVNLTAIVERDQVIIKHFLDSLSVANALPRDATALIDVGTGAGFPGIPLKILLPDLRVTLLEAVGKKVAFLDHLIATLHLRDTVAIHARAEDLARDPAHREKYAVVVARAVAELTVLLEYALPFARVGGVFIAQKGIAVEDEIRHATRALKILGGRVRAIAPVQLPGLEPRHLIVIEKIARTPATFPRRAGLPARQPLTN